MNKIKTNWNLSLIIKNPSENEIKKLRHNVEKESYKFINKWKNRSDYLEDPKILKGALDEYNIWIGNWGNNDTQWYYFSLLSSLDQNNSKIKASLNNARDLGLKIQNNIQFFELKIAKVDKKLQKIFLNSQELKSYKHFLEKLFQESKYLLTDSEEKIMNLKSVPAHSNWVQMLQGFLSKEERVVLTEDGKNEKKNFSDLYGHLESQNKKVRGSAGKALNNIFKTHIDIAENEINSVLHNKKTNDELRGYSRPDQARHLGDDIDSDVVDTVTKTISDRFDISKKYYLLKTKLLKVKKLEYYERNVEYGNITKKYSYNDGINFISEVFSGLDREFADIFDDFINQGRVDVYPKMGKKSGAFCSYNLITQPVYILLNWVNKLDDVRTFAHEMGHGINDEMMRKNQNALNFGTPTSTAEVASTFMEDFVIQELLKNANEELKLALMMSKLNQDVSSIFRQVAFYNFEAELHKNFREKGYLSKEEVGKMYKDHMNSYLGPSIKMSPGSENWWIAVHHFRYFFYVYSYASGLLISKSLQAEVKKDPRFILKVKKFLSAGLSDSPKNIFAKLGINISDKKFWEKGILEVENLLNETEKLAKKLRKI